MGLFPTSFLTIQNLHDEATFARHGLGGDLATICINGTITVNGLVDNEQDSQQFEFGSIPVRQTKIIHVLGPDLAPNVFGQDYDIGQSVEITYPGNQTPQGDWQIQTVTQSADGGNMVDITVIAAGDGE